MGINFLKQKLFCLLRKIGGLLNDAETELSREDEDELISEMESNATFDEKVNNSIARLESLNKTKKQKETSGRSSS